jgi:hypothetical protein
MKIVVIQGPNLNMLGHREQSIYGGMKLEEIHSQMEAVAKQNGFEIEFFQSNLEGERCGIGKKREHFYADARDYGYRRIRRGRTGILHVRRELVT